MGDIRRHTRRQWRSVTYSGNSSLGCEKGPSHRSCGAPARCLAAVCCDADTPAYGAGGLQIQAGWHSVTSHVMGNVLGGLTLLSAAAECHPLHMVLKLPSRARPSQEGCSSCCCEEDEDQHGHPPVPVGGDSDFDCR